MICSRCIKRSIFSRLQSQSRAFTSTPFLSTPPPTLPSTPSTPSPSSPLTTNPPTTTTTATATSSKPSQPAPKAAPLPTSSTPAGTILKGLNFFKAKDEPVAMREDEYPEWLWHCLDVKKVVDGDDAEGGDEFSKSKKLRRQAAKTKRKATERALLSGDPSLLEVKVPIQQQSIDLASEGEEALDQRDHLKKAMRTERRAKIKEGNYLKETREDDAKVKEIPITETARAVKTNR
ncbi:60S ribosomal protein l37, mitochondrial precursor (yml37)-like protein [Sclerotinia borealis F-4128]|uniref:Large ribosomal subunit protein mL54 n=1 Tax=Sclerotinia borealis (strain F-4128) TaxID=1432307 RepID=W9C7C5_SCLBF|nr:60S ribosomal protein l37, mitochondrial precursor (yml37)-like protein [Sclerotinia borealis F-4128]